ncbi:hypothetical protein EVAR_7663_1 [Eumeta japonica]|uniref:Uncharacterized protein n=1 Tax=Eumeta variegata TaxID=151549 RepID=A0A4C1TI64_EUMVA|nr:hypothetical protein EVAR_7663_1 [Eumeta japonica]
MRTAREWVITAAHRHSRPQRNQSLPVLHSSAAVAVVFALRSRTLNKQRTAALDVGRRRIQDAGPGRPGRDKCCQMVRIAGGRAGGGEEVIPICLWMSQSGLRSG